MKTTILKEPSKKKDTQTLGDYLQSILLAEVEAIREIEQINREDYTK